MGDTGISWTDKTWNPVRGCSRVSAGCQRCYAEQQAARIVRMGKGKPTPYDGLVKFVARDKRQIKIVAGEPTGEFRTVRVQEARWTGRVVLDPKTLAAPLRWRKPLRVFVNSMSDLFHEELTNEQIAAVFGVMAACPQHTFQILTKRATRMREWFAWVTESKGCTPYVAHETSVCVRAAEQHVGSLGADCHWPLPNVWIGTSVENQAAADERIPELLATPAAVRFLSCEPLLGPVDLARAGAFRKSTSAWGAMTNTGWHQTGVSWCIAGCESGPGARPCSVEWLRSLRDQCAAAGVPWFLKQAAETDMGICGDAANPNGDDPCGERVRYFVQGPKDSSVSCGCTVEGSEDANGCPPVGFGEGSRRKPGGVIELPYLDGVRHAAFPTTEKTR